MRHLAAVPVVESPAVSGGCAKRMAGESLSATGSLKPATGGGFAQPRLVRWDEAADIAEVEHSADHPPSRGCLELKLSVR
jgi:hypothetical protein